MTDKGHRQIVRLLSGPARRHVSGVDRQRFARAEMANFAAIDDRILVNIDLMAQDCIVERILVFLDQVVDASLRQQANVVLQILIALFRQLARLFS